MAREGLGGNAPVEPVRSDGLYRGQLGQPAQFFRRDLKHERAGQLIPPRAFDETQPAQRGLKLTHQRHWGDPRTTGFGFDLWRQLLPGICRSTTSPRRRRRHHSIPPGLDDDGRTPRALGDEIDQVTVSKGVATAHRLQGYRHCLPASTGRQVAPVHRVAVSRKGRELSVAEAVVLSVLAAIHDAAGHQLDDRVGTVPARQ